MAQHCILTSLQSVQASGSVLLQTCAPTRPHCIQPFSSSLCWTVGCCLGHVSPLDQLSLAILSCCWNLSREGWVTSLSHWMGSLSSKLLPLLQQWGISCRVLWVGSISIAGSGRSSGEGNGNPLQYSCLENPMDRAARWAASPWGCKESDVT